mmetsp:Transcript_5476/g.9279  ORF Transcript_5476/g.9279 Transcript_5476/m.9279 type:complete len:85 (+) Transcript_5476:24-278(+)
MGILRKVLLAYATMAASVGAQQPQDEPKFRIQEHQSLEAPITLKEFDNWETMGSTVMMKNKVVLLPEVSDRKGAIFSKHVVKSG